MKRATIFIIVIMGIFGLAKAQGDYEAFTFSQTDYLGTARFMGAGGAFGATGGDFSALSTNPAAIGLFKRNEVTITPMMLNFNYTDTRYNGDLSSAQKFKYTVPQAGIVSTHDIRRENEWKSWQFGFGYNRIMDFNNKFRAGTVTHNTLMDMVLDNVNGIDYNNLSGDGYLAWHSWLIDTIPGATNRYYSFFSNEDIEQRAVVTRTGAIDEMIFSVGGNYSDKLYIGGTLAFPFLDFKEVTSYYEEPATQDNIAGITDYNLYSEQRNTGTGVNFKLGIIYQPADFVRIGAAFHTPTYYWKIKDNFYRSLIANYSNGNNSSNGNNDWFYSNYNTFTLTTPLKFNIDASFLIAKRAFIAAEYEFQDYGMATLYNDSYDYIRENEAIREKFGVSHSLRVGGEVNVTQSFALRAGYRLKTSPYKLTDSPYNNTVHYISAGLGFRGKVIFADLAYVLRMCKDSYWLYDPTGIPCNYEAKTHSVVATIGCKF
jgi:hypothetical protein